MLTQNGIPMNQFGRRRQFYLMDNYPREISYMAETGELAVHLQVLQEEAKERYETIVEQLKQKRGIDNTLRSADSLLWAQEMTEAKRTAREIVENEMIYVKPPHIATFMTMTRPLIPGHFEVPLNG